jgi:hypothetical protein
MEQIQTFGSRCFVCNGQVIPPAAKKVKAKSEKVNFKHGKIKVQVVGAKKVKVFQEGNAMVLTLCENTETEGV